MAVQTTNDKLWKYTVAFGLSLAVSSILDALLVIAKELSPNRVQPFMKKLTGHHWVTHSAVVLGFFIVFGFLLANTKLATREPNKRCLSVIMLGGVMLGYVIIAGFYLIEG